MLKKVSLLSGVRMLQLLPQLLLIPYVLSVVGLENYGFIAFWYGVAAYTANVVGLNMEVYAVKEVFQDPNDCNAYLYPIVIKGGLAAVSVAVICGVGLYSYGGFAERMVVIFSTYHIIAVALLPTHFFLGSSAFGIFLLSTLVEKAIYVLGILLLVKSPSHYFYIPLVASLGVTAGVLVSNSYIVLGHYRGCRQFALVRSRLVSYLNVSSVLLVGKVSQLHTVGARAVLGIFCSKEFVGIYDILDKAINLMRMPITVLVQAKYADLRHDRRQYLRVATLLLFAASLIVAVALWLFPWAVGEFLPSLDAAYISWLFELLSLVVIALPFVSVFGTNYIMKNMEKYAYGVRLVIANLLGFVVLCSIVSSEAPDVAFLFWIIACEFFLAALCLAAFVNGRRRPIITLDGR